MEKKKFEKKRGEGEKVVLEWEHARGEDESLLATVGMGVGREWN